MALKIFACSHGKHITPRVARILKADYNELVVKRFPDGELYIKFPEIIKNKDVILIQSFYENTNCNLNDNLIEVIFGAKAARDLGARKIILVAPYFPYLRQDKIFHKVECMSIDVIGELIDMYFNEVIIIDPHLHRRKSLNEIFKIRAVKLSSNPLIIDYIKKEIENPIIIGPDIESYQWAEEEAKLIGCDFAILRKKRFSPRRVEVTLNKRLSLNDRNIVVIDDIISTGNTLLETIKVLRRLEAKRITCIAVHGIFADGSFERLKRAGVNLLTTNTIPNKASKIDVSGLIAAEIKRM